MATTDARRAIGFILSGGQCHDAPQGRLLMETVGPLGEAAPLVMDRAYEDCRTRRTAGVLDSPPWYRRKHAVFYYSVRSRSFVARCALLTYCNFYRQYGIILRQRGDKAKETLFRGSIFTIASKGQTTDV